MVLARSLCIADIMVRSSGESAASRGVGAAFLCRGGISHLLVIFTDEFAPNPPFHASGYAGICVVERPTRLGSSAYSPVGAALLPPPGAPPLMDRQPQRHLNTLSATTKLSTPHAVTIPSSPATLEIGTPSSIVALRASTVAVSGRSWMKGWNAAGKFEAAKNTPEKIHMGSITRLASPDTPSTVVARAATSRPSAPNVSEARSAIPASASHEPRIGTPNASIPNPTNAPT